MAITSIGTLGATNSKTANQTSISLTISAAAEAGNLVVLLIAVDNRTTGGGDQNTVTGVTDSAGGNTWTKGGSFAGTGNAQTQASIDVWFSVLTNTIANGGTISATFQTSSTSDASAISAWEFDVGAGSTAQLEGTPTTLAGTGQIGSLDVTTANQECLRIRGIASEVNSELLRGLGDIAWITTSGWTKFNESFTTGGGAASNMSVNGEWHISTGTGDASDPDAFPTGGADWATIYVAIEEILGVVTPSLIFDPVASFRPFIVR